MDEIQVGTSDGSVGGSEEKSGPLPSDPGMEP